MGIHDLPDEQAWIEDGYEPPDSETLAELFTRLRHEVTIGGGYADISRDDLERLITAIGDSNSYRPQLLRAKMRDGSPISMWWLDLGDTIPRIDADGNCHEAWTTQIRSDKFQEFSQVSKELCRLNGDPCQFRMAEDYAALEMLGVDLETIESH